MGVDLEILSLPARPTRNYRLDELTLERLNKLAGRLGGKTETQIIIDAVAHFLGSIERDQPVWVTSPSEGQKSHKRRPDAAA
jgi:hypothetical protein